MSSQSSPLDVSHKLSSWISENKTYFPIFNQVTVFFVWIPSILIFFWTLKPLWEPSHQCETQQIPVPWWTLLCTAKSCLGPFRPWAEVCLTFYQDLEISAQSPFSSLGLSGLLCSLWLCSATVKEQTGSAILQSHQQGTVKQWWAKNPAHETGQFPKDSFIWGKIVQQYHLYQLYHLYWLNMFMFQHYKIFW